MLEQAYWNSFNLIHNFGPDKFRRLLIKFSSLKEAWMAPVKEIKECGFDDKTLNKIITQRDKIDPEKEWQEIEKIGIKVMTLKDKGYPASLKEIYHPPAVIYWLGDIQVLSDFIIAVVGTRKPTAYGKQVALEIASGLAKAGITVVSGLALGIDGIVHKAVLEKRGKQAAVLGSGLDCIYPYFHQELAKKIIKENGVLLSEFPLGTPPLKHHFPYRNRIISGLSLGTLIVEADKKSGALITARYALEQNREVFAIPGSIYNKNSLGPNNLIKMGAKPVTQVEDILEALNIKQAINCQKIKEIVADSKEEELILKILSKEPVHIDQMVNETKLSAAILNSTLALMEMKGIIRNIGGMHYVLAH